MTKKKIKTKKIKRKFPYGCTKLYRKILKEVFGGEATDKQLRDADSLINEIEGDDGSSCRCRAIDQDLAMEWVAQAVALGRK